MKSIKTVREDRGVSKTAVAKHLGVNRHTYSKYEDNQEKMTVEQAIAVCDFLHVDIAEIFCP